MRTVSALLFGVLIVSALLGAALLLRSGQGMQGDSFDVFELVHHWQEAQAKSKSLDAELNELVAIDLARTQLLKKSIAGRLDLFEAARGYRDLTLTQPHLTYSVCSQAFPGRPEPEVWLRMVLRDARILLMSENLTHGQAGLSRLEADFEKYRMIYQLTLPRSVDCSASNHAPITMQAGNSLARRTDDVGGHQRPGKLGATP